MHTIISILTNKFHTAINTAFPEIETMESNLSSPQNANQAMTEKAIPGQHISKYTEIEQSTHDKFGHYQCNTAMKLTKILGQKPRDIAEKIIANIDRNHTNGHPLISDLSIAGPGFINITIDTQYLSHYVDAMLAGSHLGIDLVKDSPRIIIDFSSPNTAKEMHVGHLRSTIIGDSLARLFEFIGYDVLRLNHIGDWGTAFGMLIAYMKTQAPQVLSGEESTDLTHLVAWYRASKHHFDTDANFKKTSQAEVVSLQSGDPEALKAWKIICTISRKAYQEIYDLLDINIIERGESFYNPMLTDVINDLEAKKLITISDGAKCLFIEGFQNREGEPLPLMVQKSDGGYNYDTTDMAAIRHRIDVEKASRIIIVTDAGQAQHFRMIFRAAEMAGYLDPTKVRVDHVPFGLVLGNDGKKFRTRAGDTERLIDLLTNGIEEARKIINQRYPEMTTDDTKLLARILGINAIKYSDLSCHRTGDYTFSYERMLKFEGNTAAFLMYAYVRVAGIKRKTHASIEFLRLNHHIHLKHPTEISLGMHIAQFGETLKIVAEDLIPNRLTDYLYQLAEKFNAFFRDCRVEGTLEQDSRLLLCEITARVMHQGMQILGLHTVEKM